MRAIEATDRADPGGLAVNSPMTTAVSSYLRHLVVSLEVVKAKYSVKAHLLRLATGSVRFLVANSKRLMDSTP